MFVFSDYVVFKYDAKFTVDYGSKAEFRKILLI